MGISLGVSLLTLAAGAAFAADSPYDAFYKARKADPRKTPQGAQALDQKYLAPERARATRGMFRAAAARAKSGATEATELQRRLSEPEAAQAKRPIEFEAGGKKISVTPAQARAGYRRPRVAPGTPHPYASPGTAGVAGGATGGGPVRGDAIPVQAAPGRPPVPGGREPVPSPDSKGIDAGDVPAEIEFPGPRKSVRPSPKAR